MRTLQPWSSRSEFTSQENLSGLSAQALRWLQDAQIRINKPAGTAVSLLYADLPQSLASADAGYVAYVTDYAHTLLWNGARWQWAPGEIGGGYVLEFFGGYDPGTGWALCDGSSTTRLNSDGTTANVALPLVGDKGSFGQMTSYYRR